MLREAEIVKFVVSRDTRISFCYVKWEQEMRALRGADFLGGPRCAGRVGHPLGPLGPRAACGASLRSRDGKAVNEHPTDRAS